MIVGVSCHGGGKCLLLFASSLYGLRPFRNVAPVRVFKFAWSLESLPVLGVHMTTGSVSF